MDFFNHWLLTILIFLPSVGAILTLFAKGRDAVRWTALGTTIVTFALSLVLFATFNWRTVGGGNEYAYAPGQNSGVAESARGVVQMVQSGAWIPSFNVQYKVGIDGLSFP